MSSLRRSTRGSSRGASLRGAVARSEHRPFHYVDLHRTIAVVLLIVMAVLAALSVNGPWWTVSRVAVSTTTGQQVQNVIVSFNAGGSTSCSTYPTFWTPSPCTNISSTVTGPVGAFDVVVDVGLFVLLASSLGSAALLGIGIRGLSFGRSQFTLALVLALVSVVVALGLVGVGAAIGPGPQGATYCAYLSANQTSCPTFVGGVNAGLIPGACGGCASTVHWGGGTSFYLVLGGGAASLLAWVLLWRGRHGPFTKEEQAEWATKNRPYSLSDLPPPPVPGSASVAAGGLMAPLPVAPGRSAIPFSSERTTRWTCRRCQTVNSPWASRCGACGDHRPADR
ncbi:MAG TPA: Ran-binding zinc finger domain-containing protein [Thermoplasmata archaeon]|nr:Ran-binding zinc finger domain-containing protein [Thermoplasmata archaeon]